jgi:tetratricopeptide (TPR) repeat protein
MALKGDLASVDLAQVFQMLALNQKVGLLSIQAPRTWRALYFDPRGVTLFYNEHTLLDRVLAQMVRSGRLAEETVHDAREHAAQRGATVVESLLAGGFLGEEELDEAFRVEMEEEIYDLFFWNDARFEFFENTATFEGREGTVNDRFFFSTDSLIMEAARRIDEWSYIQERVPGPLEVYRLKAGAQRDLEANETALQLLDVIDGRRNVARLVEVTGQSAFHVYKGLANLLEQGAIEDVPPDALVQLGQECVAEGRQQDGINLFEKAIALGVGIPEVHELAAKAYESISEFERVGLHYKAQAEHLVTAGSVVAAVDRLHHVVALLPTDLQARERLLELSIGHPELKGRGIDHVAEGKELVDLYLEIGEIERVRGILERLLRDNPNDLDLKKSLVNVHMRAGDTQRVMDLYESIAEDLVRDHKPIEAVKYLQKVLMIDRSRRDVSERIRSLYELDQRRRSQRRLIVALGVLFVLIAALGCVWWVYERHARARYERIDVTPLIAVKDFAGAEAAYRAFITGHPFTIVANEAEGELRRIESLRTAHEQELENTRRGHDTRLGQIRADYRREWERYQNESKNGDLDAALEALDEVRRILAMADQEVDRQWAHSVQLETNRQQLKNHLSEAHGLQTEARELRARGDWRRARENLVKLTTQYDRTKVARHVRVPVQLLSRPAGAEVWRNGKPLTLDQGGTPAPVCTPVVLDCHPLEPEEFELRLDGYARVVVKVQALEKADSEHVLTVSAERRITFPHPAQTTPGVGRGYVVAGLRGGWLGIARIANGKVVDSVKLSDLNEVLGGPSVGVDRVVFRTNESRIHCHFLNGRAPWLAALKFPSTHDPVARDGRVFVADTQGRLMCLDLDNGTLLWQKPLDGLLSGLPAVESRFVRAGTQTGEVVVFDAADGSELWRCKADAGLATAPQFAKGLILFGTTDGRLVALRDKTGAPVWQQSLPSALNDGELRVDGELVLCAGGERELHCYELGTGALRGKLALPGELRSGPVVAGGKAFVVVREQGTPPAKAKDIALAVDVATMTVAYDYRDGGTFMGGLAGDGSAVCVVDSSGAVVRLR